MFMLKNTLRLFVFFSFLWSCSTPKQPMLSSTLQCDVLVIGGGCGGTAAGIQSARSGAKAIICAENAWLGGMLSAAGVSATDGNHRLPSGLWKEFRAALYAHYGGPEAVATGWVSNTQFEPHVADSILKTIARQEQRLEVRHHYALKSVLKNGNSVQGASFTDPTGKTVTIQAKITIDATELGDVLAGAGAAYSLGVDARADCGEADAPEQGSPLVQDLTWAAILQDYGPGTDHTVPKSAAYNPSDFYCCCADRCAKAEKVHSCATMLSYAKLPRNKIMINWPLNGNDAYLNMAEMTPEARENASQRARTQTLDFIHYIQTELGYKNLGLARHEFPTPDHLPLIPYHRESRRVKGIVRLNVNHILAPFEQPQALYRTGISVGDYPLDHHHAKAPELPAEKFPPIPSFNVPLGALIPAATEGLIVAEKNISVTHLVNGSTRLQPCVLLTGQAAGVLAAAAAKQNIPPRRVNIRAVQAQLLDAGAFLMPYLDVSPDDPAWKSVQRVGAAGLMRGRGIPHDWANETWFYPDSMMKNTDLLAGLQDWRPGFYAHVRMMPQTLTAGEMLEMVAELLKDEPVIPHFKNKTPSEADIQEWIEQEWVRISGTPLTEAKRERPVLRKQAAQFLDAILQPFGRDVDWDGMFRKK